MADHGGVDAAELYDFERIVERSNFDDEEPSADDASVVWAELNRLETLFAAQLTRRRKWRGRVHATSLKGKKAAEQARREAVATSIALQNEPTGEWSPLPPVTFRDRIWRSRRRG